MGMLAGLVTAILVKTPVAWLGAPVGGAAIGGLTGYLMAMSRQASWESEGRRRQRDAEDNRMWEAQQFWQAEVRRVMQGQRASRFGSQQQRQRQRDRASQEARPRSTVDDFGLLGLERTPPPTAAEVASAYRREAMKWHPDHNLHLPASELAECEEHFKALNEAHGRLRREARARGG